VQLAMTSIPVTVNLAIWDLSPHNGIFGSSDHMQGRGENPFRSVGADQPDKSPAPNIESCSQSDSAIGSFDMTGADGTR
jgi:hypothetical protein